MQDSAGRAGKAQQNRIDTGEAAPACQTNDSQSDLYPFESSGHGHSIPGSPLPEKPSSRVRQQPYLPAYDPPEYYLPRKYDETVLSLMVRDPYWVYAYWDICRDDMQRIERDHGLNAWDTGAKMLRVYDITEGSAHRSRFQMSIGIGDESTSWYVNVPAANRMYRADIVLITPEGYEITLARSNTVITPRDGVSDVIDEEWMVLSEYDKLYWMSAGFGPSSPEFQRRFVSRGARRRLLMGSQLLAAGFSPGGSWATGDARRPMRVHAFDISGATVGHRIGGRIDGKIT